MSYFFPFILTLSYLIYSNVSEINYNPKLLYKVLQKKAGIENPEIKELKNSKIEALQLNGKIFTLENPKNELNLKYIYIGRVNSCRAGGCSSNTQSNTNLESEYFDYFIIYDKDINVKNVRVYNYQATHGQEVTAIGWLNQFIGYNGSQNLNVGKNIDAISGATISVYAITYDIENKTYMLKNIVSTI